MVLRESRPSSDRDLLSPSRCADRTGCCGREEMVASVVMLAMCGKGDTAKVGYTTAGSGRLVGTGNNGVLLILGRLGTATTEEG
jgi:hypothetical protein